MVFAKGQLQLTNSSMELVKGVLQQLIYVRLFHKSKYTSNFMFPKFCYHFVTGKCSKISNIDNISIQNPTSVMNLYNLLIHLNHNISQSLVSSSSLTCWRVILVNGRQYISLRDIQSVIRTTLPLFCSTRDKL